MKGCMFILTRNLQFGTYKSHRPLTTHKNLWYRNFSTLFSVPGCCVMLPGVDSSRCWHFFLIPGCCHASWCGQFTMLTFLPYPQLLSCFLVWTVHHRVAIDILSTVGQKMRHIIWIILFFLGTRLDRCEVLPPVRAATICFSTIG